MSPSYSGRGRQRVCQRDSMWEKGGGEIDAWEGLNPPLQVLKMKEGRERQNTGNDPRAGNDLWFTAYGEFSSATKRHLVLLTTWMHKAMDSLLKLSERNAALPTLWFQPTKTHVGLDL